MFLKNRDIWDPASFIKIRPNATKGPMRSICNVNNHFAVNPNISASDTLFPVLGLLAQHLRLLLGSSRPNR